MIAACWPSAAPVSWELHLSWSPEAALGPAGSSFGVSDLRDDFFSKAEKECHAFVRQVINALSQGTRYQLGPIRTEFPSSGSRR